MWFAIIFIGLFIAALAFAPKPKVENARAGNLSEFRFPRSAEGHPLPLGYGTFRLRAPNTLWYGDYKAVAIREKVKTGMFSSKKVTVGYKYYLGIDLALVLGPGVVLKKIWAGKHLAWSGTAASGDITINKPSLFGGKTGRGGLKGTATFYPGNYSQARDAYLAEKCDPNVPGYCGLAHIVFKSFYVGNSTNPEAFNFELQYLPTALGGGYSVMPNGLDLNPMEALYDLFAIRWGRLGISPAMIDTASWVQCAATLYAEGNGLSMEVTSANSGQDLFEEVLRQINGVVYQDPVTEKIMAKLIRYDYDPDTIPVFDTSNVIQLRSMSKSLWEGTYNQVRVKFPNRAKDYEDGAAMAQDFANVNYQNRVRSSDLAFPGCSNDTLANALAVRSLSSISIPLYKVELLCNREAMALRPGSVFKLNWSPFHVSGMIFRVQQIDLGDLESGGISVQAIQDEFSANAIVFTPPEESLWNPPDYYPTGGGARSYLEAPYFILQAAGIVPADTESGLLVVAQAPTAASLGFSAIASNDGWVTTLDVLDTSPYYGGATLVNSLADTTAVTDGIVGNVAINMADELATEVLKDYAGISSARDGSTLFWMNGEWFLYVSYTKTGTGAYTLEGVRRALFDSIPASHAALSKLWFVVGQEGLMDSLFPRTATVKSKLLDVTGFGELDPEEAAEDSTILDSRTFRPAPPDYLTLNGNRTAVPVTGVVAVAWRARNRKSTTVELIEDAASAAEAGTDYELKWRMNAGAWNTSYPAASPQNIDLTGLTGTLDVEVRSRRDGMLSWTADKLSTTVT